MTWAELRMKCKRQSDYIVTLFITNEVSLLLTWILIKTRITPNQVTAASILAGLGCALCYAFEHFLVGSILLFVAHALDCTDGNLARAKSCFSPIGKWLDMTGDRITEAILFMAVSFYFLRVGASEYWIIVSLVDAIILSIYYYTVDTGLALGLSKPLQHIGGMKFKDVNVKWGLLEPVLYGFILLAPLGYIKVQLIFVFFIATVGISYQYLKMLTPHDQLP